MRLVATLSLIVLSVFVLPGCGDKSVAGSGGASNATPAATPTFEPADVQVAKTLTDEKMANYVVYEKEMLPTLAIISELMADSRKSGKSFSSMGTDPRMKAVEDAQKAACKKTGIDASEIPGFTTLTGGYYAQAGVSIDAQKELDAIRTRAAAAKAAGKEQNIIDAATEEVHVGTLAEMDALRKKYETKYGKAVVDILRKYEADFSAINAEKVKAFLTAPASK